MAGMAIATVVIRWLGRVVLIGLALLVLLVLLLLVAVPRVTHGAALTVLTGSMRPALPVNSVVIERPVDPADLQVGDIVTYQQQPGRAVYITHRVAGIDRSTSPATFTLKGDANRIADAMPVPATAIRGKVWLDVPYAGWLRQAPGFRSAAMVLGVLGLGAYSVSQLVAGVRERRRHKADPASSASTAGAS